MKKVYLFLGLAFTVIAAIMIYLVKVGVSLRPALYIKPSAMSDGLNTVARDVGLRLFPEFQDVHYVVWGLSSSDPEAEQLLNLLKTEEEHAKGKPIQILPANQPQPRSNLPGVPGLSTEQIKNCKEPCWIVESQERASELSSNSVTKALVLPLANELHKKYFTLTVLDFEFGKEVPEECWAEKRLDFHCIKAVSVQTVEKKLPKAAQGKPQSERGRYFFLNKYNDSDFFFSSKENLKGPPLMKFRIKDVENFVETAPCTTILQAAQKLEISQPALSESLKRLETDLGFILFYRSRSGIQLTSSGRVFLGKAQAALQACKELDLNPEGNEIFGGRTITIGCHATVAAYSIPKTLSFLKQRAPDYRIALKHDLSRNIQAEIQRGTIDIGVVINPVEVPDLVVQKLAVDTVGVWLSKSLKSSDTIICNTHLFQTQSILKKWRGRPERVIETESLELICQLVEEKIGYGIIPARAVQLSGFKFQTLTELPSFKDEVSLVYRPEFGKAPAERLTIEALKHAILATS